VPYELDSHIQTKLRFRHGNVPDVPFLIGGARDYHELRGNFVNDLFTGKQDRPALFNKFMTRDEFDAIAFGSRPLQADILAYWDTSVGLGPNGAGQRVTDTGPNTLHAEGVNHPVRCMTGWNWNGKDDCFRLAPEQYGGIEFHPDTVTDCKWVETNRMTIPNDLKSGVYALRLRVGAGQGISEEYIVFFVRPKTPQAKLAFLVPTASYLAYANESLSFDAHIIQPMTGQPPVVTDIDIETYEHREFGLSTYDSYEDGAGVCYSSYLRPVINMRPKYRLSSMNITWQFPADLSIVAWIEKMGY
jgi:N,N-dimethylformamidase